MIEFGLRKKHHQGEENMSQEAAKKFIKKCQKDPNFKKSLHTAKDQKEVNAILKKNNFIFTKEEYKAAAKTVLAKEVSDEDLKHISGMANHNIALYTER